MGSGFLRRVVSSGPCDGETAGLAGRRQVQALLGRMALPDKRVWLSRLLYRHHRDEALTGVAADLLDPPIVFVECDRAGGNQLEYLRQQLADGTGLGSDELTGDFEVRRGYGQLPP